jgi:hypothetical protein
MLAHVRGPLSSQHGASWRDGLQVWWVVENTLNKQLLRNYTVLHPICQWRSQQPSLMTRTPLLSDVMSCASIDRYRRFGEPVYIFREGGCYAKAACSSETSALTYQITTLAVTVTVRFSHLTQPVFMQISELETKHRSVQTGSIYFHRCRLYREINYCWCQGVPRRLSQDVNVDVETSANIVLFILWKTVNAQVIGALITRTHWWRFANVHS